MTKTYKKLDDETVEVTTTIPKKVTKENRDRAELQTELHHIPDSKKEFQEELDVINGHEAELIEILKVFD